MTAANADQVHPIDRGRYRQILWFFARVIFHLIWWDLLLGRLFLFRGRVRRTRPDRFRRHSRRFRHLAVEMGGVMIKLGQFFSSRVDVLPPEVTEELAGLQDEVPPVPWEQVQSVLVEELGDPSEHFAQFERVPVAAASLGQAHQAWLVGIAATDANNPQVPVVVKVQRPGIVDIVQTDLAAFQVIARWAMRYGPIRRRADVPALMEEFAATLWEELDYISEADNAERFGVMFADSERIVVPAVHREHSTGRVLVLEDVSGIKIADIEGIQAAGIDPSDVALLLLDVYFYQIFKQGFFHADPHPGNLFVLPGGEAYEEGQIEWPFRLSFVDFGMVGRIETLVGDSLRKVLTSVTQKDARALTEAYDDLGFFLPGSDLERIAEAQAMVLDRLWGRNLLELSQPDPREVQELGREFRDLLFEFPFQVPQDFIFLGRAMGMLSGLVSSLDPTINPWQLVEKYGREIIASQEVRQAGLRALQDWFELLVNLPMKVQRVLTAAEEGRLRVQMTPDQATIRRLERLERRAARVNWSLLASAAAITGALLYMNGDSFLGIVAWLTSAFLILVMLIRRS